MPGTIVQIVQHLRPGGIETLALDLRNNLSPRHRVQIISLEGTPDGSLGNWPGLRNHGDALHFLDKQPGLSPATLIRLVALLRRLRPQVIHTHHIGPLLYGGLAARLCGIRNLVHTEHDAWHLSQRPRARLQQRLIRLTRPTLVADARLVASNSQRFLKNSTYQVIPNGIDTRYFTPAPRKQARRQLELPQGVKLLGCAARLEAEKGHRTLLAALSHLPADCHLALAGQGSLLTELRRQSRQLGISERVHFLGNLEQMPVFYQALDLFCLASDREGLPLAPLEAQSCGIPCVLTRAGGAAEALCPQTGLLVTPGNVGMLVQAIGYQLENSNRIRPDISPRDFVCRNGDSRSMSQAYEACYGL